MDIPIKASNHECLIKAQARVETLENICGLLKNKVSALEETIKKINDSRNDLVYEQERLEARNLDQFNQIRELRNKLNEYSEAPNNQEITKLRENLYNALAMKNIYKKRIEDYEDVLKEVHTLLDNIRTGI